MGMAGIQLDAIGFDADDTLWHSENLYADTQDKFRALLAGYGVTGGVDERLLQTEMRNLQFYGYGVKGFTLSLIETAVDLTEGRIAGDDIQRIIGWARQMMTADIRMLDHAQETLETLAAGHDLMLITKGDLFDQENKIARSGLRPYFRRVEIVTDKTRDRYAAVLARHGVAPARFLMVGNSMRSDILPVLALGGRAVYIPYHIAWAHEHAAPADGAGDRCYVLDHLGLLPALIQMLAGGQSMQDDL